MSSHAMWEALILFMVALIPSLCIWEYWSCLFWSAVVSLVVFEVSENKWSLRRCLCGGMSIVLLAPGALFGMMGLLVLISLGVSAYFVWCVVERAGRGYWFCALTLLSFNPGVVASVHQVSLAALESMVLFVLMYSFGHVVSAWSSS